MRCLINGIKVMKPRIDKTLDIIFMQGVSSWYIWCISLGLSEKKLSHWVTLCEHVICIIYNYLGLLTNLYVWSRSLSPHFCHWHLVWLAVLVWHLWGHLCSFLCSISRPSQTLWKLLLKYVINNTNNSKVTVF